MGLQREGSRQLASRSEGLRRLDLLKAPNQARSIVDKAVLMWFGYLLLRHGQSPGVAELLSEVYLRLRGEGVPLLVELVSSRSHVSLSHSHSRSCSSGCQCCSFSRASDAGCGTCGCGNIGELSRWQWRPVFSGSLSMRMWDKVWRLYSGLLVWTGAPVRVPPASVEGDGPDSIGVEAETTWLDRRMMIGHSLERLWVPSCMQNLFMKNASTFRCSWAERDGRTPIAWWAINGAEMNSQSEFFTKSTIRILEEITTEVLTLYAKPMDHRTYQVHNHDRYPQHRSI